MTHTKMKFAAAIGAVLLPLAATVPAAYAASPQTRAASEPVQTVPNRQNVSVGAVYLNGWSSSNNPDDCNKGCTNSNGG